METLGPFNGVSRNHIGLFLGGLCKVMESNMETTV